MKCFLTFLYKIAGVEPPYRTGNNQEVFHCRNIPRCCFLPISKLLRLSLSISPPLPLYCFLSGGERTPAIPENWLMALWPFWNFFGSGLAALGSWLLAASGSPIHRVDFSPRMWQLCRVNCCCIAFVAWL